MKNFCRELVRVVCVNLFIIFFALTYYAQTGNRIIGMVFNPERTPISQVNVELLDEYSRVVGRTRTDGSGRYVFSGMSSGRYYVKVLTFDIGLEEQIREVEIYNFSRTSRTPAGGVTSVTSSNEVVQADFYLRQPKNDSDNFITGVIFVQEVPLAAKAEFEKADRSLSEKKVIEGIAELKEAVRIFPTYFLALNRLGQEQINNGKFQEAVETLKKAIEVNPKAYNSWYFLGYAYYSLKNVSDAVKSATTSLELKPTIQNLTLLGVVKRQNKEFRDAEKFFLQAKKLSKNSVADIHWNLALLYAHNLKEFDNAASELELFVKARNEKNEEEKIRKLIILFRKIEKYLKIRPEVRKNESYENIVKIVNNT